MSVIIPTYNRPEHAKRAVASVAEQTYDPIELVVVDDSSDTPVETVLSPDQLRSFDRYEIIRHDENRGGSAARNTGIRAARGEYVAFLDDDDRWDPEKIARQLPEFRDPDVGAVFTGGRTVDGDGEPVSVARAPDSTLYPPELTKQLLCRNVVGSCTGIVVDADVIERAGTFDERFPSWQDQEWYVRLSRHCAFGTVPEPLFVYNDDSQGKVSDDVEALRNETYPLFVEKFDSLAGEFGRLFRRKMLAWASYRVGKALVEDDEIYGGRTFLVRAVRLYPFERRFYKFLLASLGGPAGYTAARRAGDAWKRLT